MLKQLFGLLGKENQLAQAIDRSHEMLRECREMFEAASRSLRERNDARMQGDIYAKDQIINAYEREVRRRVFTHLTLASSRDLGHGLILASVVIDIERIGDYTKNIVELALHHPRRLQCGPFEKDVSKIENTVRTMFGLLLEALPESDEDKAREVMSEHWWIAKRGDEILYGLVQNGVEGLTTADAVATGLYVRYLKRVSAHLMNIASSVVNPFDRIGFRSQPGD